MSIKELEMANKATSDVIVINPVTRRTARFAVVGRSPLIINRLAEKAKQELLLPKGKKTAGEKAVSLKHDPYEEYRSSAYIVADGDTALALPSVAFKKAMATAALEMPGAKKTQILRLVYMPDAYVSIYGVPNIFCSITRSADINKTPDVRTRCIVPRWAAVVTIDYAHPQLSESSIANLLNAAGFICGVGDWRQEKGSGNYGAFEVTSPTAPEFVSIVNTGTRAAQMDALENPIPFDAETAELLSWFEIELNKRGQKDFVTRKEVANA